MLTTCNYADDTSPDESVQHCDNLISNLELIINKNFSWVKYNDLKANTSKCHYVLSTSPYQHF